MSLGRNLGRNLRFLRKQKGMSQQALANAVGLRRNNIASYEAGISEPRAVVFLRLAEFFEVEPLEFYILNICDHQHHHRTDPGDGQQSGASSRSGNLMTHLLMLRSKTEDMEKVLEGFRTFYQYRRKRNREQAVSTQSFANDFEGLILMLEELLKTNRQLFEKSQLADVRISQAK